MNKINFFFLIIMQKPKKPLNGNFLFQLDMLKKYKRKFPDVDQPIILSLISKQYFLLDKKKKEKYEKKFLKAKKKYKKDLSDYKRFLEKEKIG